MITFVGGWTEYVLRHPDSASKFAGHLSGVRAILQVYQNNKTVREDDTFRDLIAVDKKGNLETWLKEKISSK